MNCLNEGALSAYFDAEMGLLERLNAEHHLMSCGRCRNEFKIMSKLEANLRSRFTPPMPESLRCSLESMIPEAAPCDTPPRGLPLTHSIWSAAFACAALALVLWHHRLAAEPEVPADLLIAAHDQFAVTTPLPPEDVVLARLPEEMTEQGPGEP